MKNTKRMYLYNGMKSSLLWDEETDAWVYHSGAPLRESAASYYGIIPTLYRGVDKRAKAVASLPWVIYKGETEYDTSDDYENNTGLVANMVSLLWLIEAALTLTGRAYLKREKKPAGYDKVRYIVPSSITLDELKLKTSGEIEFIRQANSTTVHLTTKELIYLWNPDPLVEIGPPTVSPASSALAACGVLANLDEFAKDYFGRGAIKAMLFAMQGAPKGEAEKFESWWNKYVSGIKNAFRTKVINAEKVEPVIVGEGIKELENVTIGKEKREEIAIALDIPLSLLFSNAANYATAEQDKLNWYTDVVIPEAEFIASTLNQQLYQPLGYHLEFDAESLSIFQEDEEQRSVAMSQFMDALDKAGDIEMAKALFLIYGIDVSEDAMALIEQHFANKQERAEVVTEQMQPNTDEPEEEKPEEEIEEEQPVIPPEKSVDLYKLSRELSIWESKCLKALKRGDGADSVVFMTDVIPDEIFGKIQMGLKDASAAGDVKAVFMRETMYDASNKKPGEFDEIVTVLREAIKAIDNEPVPTT